MGKALTVVADQHKTYPDGKSHLQPMFLREYFRSAPTRSNRGEIEPNHDPDGG
jgi:hypothetical protein